MYIYPKKDKMKWDTELHETILPEEGAINMINGKDNSLWWILCPFYFINCSPNNKDSHYMNNYNIGLCLVGFFKIQPKSQEHRSSPILTHPLFSLFVFLTRFDSQVPSTSSTASGFDSCV